LSELGHFDEALIQLKRAHELTRELSENYGDEITRTIRNVKRYRWNKIEEKRIRQEIDLQNYLHRLMLDDKNAQLKSLGLNTENNEGNKNLETINNEIVKVGETQPSPTETVTNNNDNTSKDKQVAMNQIEADYQQRLNELDRLFAVNDSRRKKREIPDYICGKISFEILNDPVITPSGITYDRNDIEQHLQRVGRFDPVTRTELSMDQLIPNLAMKEVVEHFVNENEWVEGEL
jgi:STIP1 homology and U-box containing protein 1